MQKAFSHHQWVEVAKTFIRTRARSIPGFSGKVRTAKALSATKLSQTRKSLPIHLPKRVAEFLSSAASSFQFRYEWELSGGPLKKITHAGLETDKLWGGTTLCNAVVLPRWVRDCRAWAEETWIADDPDEQTVWLECLPIGSLDNGDYLAVKTGRDDPPVVYLSHDDASRVISPSFTAFLKTWERLCYLGPEIWMLENFIDPKTGFLSADTEKAAALRDLFRLE